MQMTEEDRRIGVSVLSQSEIVYVGLCASVTQHPDLVCCPHQEEDPAGWSFQALSPRTDVVVAVLAPDALWDVVQALNITAQGVPVVGVIETHTVSEESVAQLVRAGIIGLTTSMCAETIISIVRLAVQHVTMMDTTLMQVMMRHAEGGSPFRAEGVGVADLSTPDRRLVAWIAHGYSNRQIAVEFGTTVSGVKHRVSKVLKQLRVPSRILLLPLYFTYEQQWREHDHDTVRPKISPSDHTQDEDPPSCEGGQIFWKGESPGAQGRGSTTCRQNQ
jgi:DNA-binding NarL/FixJ family response regulator